MYDNKDDIIKIIGKSEFKKINETEFNIKKR